MNGIAERSVMWNLWHGCHKFSEGCRYCYVYRGDAKGMLTVRLWLRRKISICLYGRIRTEVLKFRTELLFIPVLLPIFVEDADAWRTEAWEMIRQRSDLHFLMITKRINRVMECLPVDWKDGYDNVTICCTVEISYVRIIVCLFTELFL